MEGVSYNDLNHSKFVKILHKKFLTSYPDTFLKNNTNDKDIYESANGAMYSWYIMIVQKFSFHNLSSSYSKTKEELIKSNHTNIQRFLDDFEKSENWQEFLFKNVVI